MGKVTRMAPCRQTIQSLNVDGQSSRSKDRSKIDKNSSKKKEVVKDNKEDDK